VGPAARARPPRHDIQPLRPRKRYKMRRCLRCLSRPSDPCCRPDGPSHRPHPPRHAMKRSSLLLAALAVSVPVAMAQQDCISLSGSTACPAFSSASISRNLTGQLYVPVLHRNPQSEANAYPSQLFSLLRVQCPDFRSEPAQLYRNHIHATTVSRPSACESNKALGSPCR